MRISKHCKERMDERGISIHAAANCLQNGKKYINKHDNNKYTFIDKENNVYVVTDKAMTTVITVFRREF